MLVSFYHHLGLKEFSLFSFLLHKQSQNSHARAGVLSTAHGDVLTPAFMPVGTLASVKGLSPRDLKEMGTELIVANTYHLFLQPGTKVLEAFEGIHSFMAWDGPVLTDSGGFQVFSLGLGKKDKQVRWSAGNNDQKLAYEIKEDGVWFKSHINGDKYFLTPELSIQIQESIGADIILAFDECPPAGCGYEYTKKAMDLTHRWAIRSIAVKNRKNQAIFGIVQGGIYDDLRTESAAFIRELSTDGFAIGGLAVGEKKPDMHRVLDVLAVELPPEKPRHLLGVGAPEDLIEGVRRGIDIFDCVLPTRLGRHGSILRSTGKINIKNARFTFEKKPIEETCSCYTCKNFSLAYLQHLFKAHEALGGYLASYHNVYFLLKLMRKIRDAILKDQFEGFAEEFLQSYQR